MADVQHVVTGGKSSSRLEPIDIAKGIGIILVYIGHIPIAYDLRSFIYNFHMPLFFFLSGLFLNEKKYTIQEFFKARCKSLLVPLVTFIIVSVVLGLIPDFNISNPQF